VANAFYVFFGRNHFPARGSTRHVGEWQEGAGGEDGCTYREPTPNIADTAIFLLVGSCSFHTQPIGMIKIMTSETMFMTPLASTSALTEKQLPLVTKIFQIFSRGLQRPNRKPVIVR
jgi:hypothetical protein